tara:strand:- start:432 stop:875 length:444 start_codon:yes stop_codon:yes gene_type:complete
MSIKLANLAQSTISSSISDSDTSLSVSNASSFPTITGSEFFFATLGTGVSSEIVKVTQASGTTFTVLRGQDGTTASAHNSGTDIGLRINKAVLEEISDKTVSLNESGTAEVTGTYPNFTISAPSVTSAFTNDSNFLDNNSTIDAGNF